jgi:MATE family multidrug resistance protein
MPGILMMALFDANRVFLNALNYTFVPTLVQMVGVPLHFAWAYYFVRVKHTGMVGVCYAHNITYLTLCILITTYSSRIEAIKEAWFMPTSKSLAGFTDYLKLGLPGSLMMCVGWLGTDVMPFYAGLIGTKEQAVCALLVNFETLIFQFSLGMSVTACILVGNAVGAGNEHLAIRCAKLCFISTATFLSVMFVVIYLMMDKIARLFTSD